MTTIVLTYEDFAALPANGKRYELHEGELTVSPAPTPRHQRVIGNLFLILAPHVRASGRGEILLSPFDCILTNVHGSGAGSRVRRRRTAPPRERTRARRQPFFGHRSALSSCSINTDRRRKMALYGAHDVTWYWIADPDARTIEAYRLAGRAYRVEGVLEGAAPRALPPFADLLLDPAAVWA